MRVQVLAFYTKQAPGSEITSLCTKAREMTDQLTGQLLSMTKQKKKSSFKKLYSGKFAGRDRITMN